MADFQLPGKLLLSPMAGVSDFPFREVCRRLGSQGGCIQLLSANAVVMNSQKTFGMVDLQPHELQDSGIQVFGGDGDIMAEAIKRLSEYRPLYIDINMGCSVPKILRSEGGAYLLCHPARAYDVFKKAVAATDLPVTIKTRLGPSHEHINVLEVAQAAQEAGISAIALHGRTVSDKFGGRALWDYIRQLKEAVEIPVIGNGDLFCAADIQRMLRETGCDAVLVARGAMGYPWIFREARALLAGEPLPLPPTAREMLDTALSHHQLMVEKYGDDHGSRQMRKHYGWYLRCFPHASLWRGRFMEMKCVAGAGELMRELSADLHQRGLLDEPVRPQARPEMLAEMA